MIGATGRVGREVVSQLQAAGKPVRAMARTPESAGLPEPVEVVYGDLTLPATLDRCLEGADSVFLVWTAPPDTVAGTLDQVTKRARRIVFLSAPFKTPHPFFQQPNPARRVAEQIERSIEGAGIEWTFLRPGMFAANARHFWGPQIRGGNIVRWPYLAAPTAPIDERDIAAVAVRALCEDGHAGAEYVLTGPESLRQLEQIATIGDVTGRALRIEEMSPEETRREWAGLYPPPAIDMLLNAWAAAVGQAAHVTSTFAEITGRPARKFREWVADHAADFRG